MEVHREEGVEGLVVKTVGIVEPLCQALRPLATRIHAAFVYGSVARGSDRTGSDLDLLVISGRLIEVDIEGQAFKDQTGMDIEGQAFKDLIIEGMALISLALISDPLEIWTPPRQT